MIYRGPGFLAVVLFGSMPTPSLSPFPSVSWIGDTQEDLEKEAGVSLTWGGAGVEPNYTTAE
jgi:hypothetical protein